MVVILPLVLICLLVLADQLLKLWAIAALAPIGTYVLIDGILRLNYIENTGAAFGMMSEQWWLLIGGTSIVLIAGLVLIVLKKLQSKLALSAAVLIISGGIGNLIDRIFRGFVVDYIDVYAINFAVFNFADICVCVGVGLLFLYILFGMNDSKKADKKHA